MSLYARLVAGLVLAVAMLAGWHALTTHYDRQGYDRAKAEDKAVADLQQERNRELQRQAEKSYVVTQGARDRFHTVTVKEITHDAAPLADCPVPPAVVMRANQALACARDDTAASCGAGEPLPGAERTP